MRTHLVIAGIAGTLALGPASGSAQSARPLGETRALFDTTVAHLVELELELVKVRAQGRNAPHPSVAGITRQIAALHELLAEFPDTSAVNAAVRDHLVSALQARLASAMVTQRLIAARLDSVPPLRTEEELLRARLRELGVPEPE